MNGEGPVDGDGRPNDASPGRELVPEEWRDLDDTLADGPSTAAVPAAAKAWLADQRLMHGLLRALHTPDPSAREGRIAAVLERLDAEPAPSSRRWGLVAALALLLAAVSTWLWLPTSLPTAEATVQRAQTELQRDVNRRFRLQVAAKDKNGQPMLPHEFALVTHPGSRFRVEGWVEVGRLRFPIRLGCDGKDMWFDANNFRRSVPLDEREQLHGALGHLLDVGYLDVQHLLTQLGDGRNLRVVGRERGADGRSLLRIEATSRTRLADRRGLLLCDEQTGMVVRLKFDATTNRGDGRTIELEYLGEEASDPVAFQRPW